MRHVVWLLANALDCDAYGLWCRSHCTCDSVETCSDLDVGLAHCHLARPALLILDPAVGESAIERAIDALNANAVGRLLVLDCRPVEGRLVQVLDEPAASYMSRRVTSAELAAAIEGILLDGARAIDPAFAGRLRRTRRGFEFREPVQGSFAALSERERQIMRLLAQGKSVRECAAALGLAHSTIDNHKARLMKKLGVHKISELTCRAVREGLIVL
jgi:DNA-binding NarL/FixJ family response regulator